MMIFAFVGCGALLICIVIIILINSNKKFNFINAKIEEAEKNIEIYLDKKYDLLRKIEPLVKKKVKKAEFFTDEVKSAKKADPLALNTVLDNSYHELLKIADDNDSFDSNSSIANILSSLKFNEIELSAAIKYFNDSSSTYNKFVSSFPSSFLAMIKKYKTKELFEKEKKEIYDILNEG